MKRILIAAVMLGLAGGAYAADFGNLGINVADLKAASLKNPTVVKFATENIHAPTREVSFKDPDLLGNCQILYPNRTDKNNKYCGETSFGVAYNGFLDRNMCYDSLDAAIKAMRATSSCSKMPIRENCTILYPNRTDKNNTYCGETSFGVAYNGFLDRNLCYESIDKAMAAMEETTSCLKDDVLNGLKLLYPNHTDKNNTYCGGTSFGVTYKGFLVRNACYNSIDKAMAAMEAFDAAVGQK